MSGTPTLTNSKLIQISDVSGSTRIIARQDIVLDVGFLNNSNSNAGITCFDSTGEMLATQYATTAHWITLNAEVTLKKNDWIRFSAGNNANYEGGITINATPLVSDCILLSSQDEIFSQWTSYSPTLNGVTSSAANTKFAWRRVGDSMEIAGSWYTDSVSASELYFTLPSGYEIDQSTFYAGDRTSVGVASRISNGIYGYEKGNTCNLFIKAGGTNLDRIYFNHQSSGTNFTGVNGNTFMTSSESCSVRIWSVPIKGWSSAFNPVLSMPLVEYGGDIEEYRAYQFQEGSSVNYRARMSGTQLVNTVSTLGTVTNDASYGWYFAPNQRVKVNISWSQACSTTEAGLCVVKYPSSFGTPSSVADANSGNSAWDPYRVTGIQDTNGAGYQGNVSSSFIAEAGDYIQLAFENTNWQTSAKSLLQMTVEKVYSNTSLAHIIKPSVVTISHENTSYGTWGGDIGGTNAWHTRTLNTIRGESWFVESFASNVFSLSAGHYKCIGQSPIYAGNQHKSRLYNTTDSEAVLVGNNSYANASYNGQTSSLIMGSFTITKSTSFRVETIINNDNGGISQGGFDSGGSNSGPAVFTTIMIEKLK